MTAYATLTDLTNSGLTAAAIGTLTSGQQQKALDAANALADGYLGARFRLPLTSWGVDLTDKVVAIAAWRLMSLRGFDPEGGSDQVLRMSYEDAIRWFEHVAAGKVVPVVGTSDATSTPGGPYVQEPTAAASGGFVVAKPTSRGW